MKKYFSVFFAAMMALSCFTACGSDSAATKEKTNIDSKSLQIVTTIFPEYDWVKNILGEESSHADITMLLDNGVDLHSYQPTADDILKVSTCDLFLYVGGESDAWVEDALKNATNKEMQVINLMDVMGDAAKEEEVVEGMQPEEEEEEEDSEEEPELDEHVWLSLKNASVFCDAIAGALEKLDPDHAETYHNNASEYKSELNNLDSGYQSAVENAAQKTLLFGDRFPFRYLVDDYGLSYYAAFVGCSAETEASFETITFLADKVDALGLKHVMTIEKSDQKIAKTIIENTAEKNQDILTLDSMQSTTSDDVENGITYLSIMENNLIVLQKALQ